MRREPVSLETRIALVQQRAVEVTLDGHRAAISGYRNDFATVGRLDGHGGRVEFAWETVAHIINNQEGRFRS